MPHPIYPDPAQQPRDAEPVTACDGPLRPSFDAADNTALSQLCSALTAAPRRELETLLSAPRHLRLINPSPQFAHAVICLPPPRAWPHVLMDDWVLENIDTAAVRIAVPSLIIVFALQRETGSLHCHVTDLSLPALQQLQQCQAVDAKPCLPNKTHVIRGTLATHAWQLIDESRHYASFDHRHTDVDPELRMRIPPRWVPMLLPGVAPDANDAAWSAVAKRSIDSLLSPWLPIGLVDCANGDAVAGGLSLSALHADIWIDETSTWVLARTAEIHQAIGSYRQISAALQAMHLGRCAEPERLLFDERAFGLGCKSSERVISAMRAMTSHHLAWSSLPAFNWLMGAPDDSQHELGVSAARENPDRALAQLLRDVEALGADPSVAAFLRSMGNQSADEWR